jgi:hypothetical protein
MRHSYPRRLALALVLALSLVGLLTSGAMWPGRAQAATPGPQRYLGRCKGRAPWGVVVPTCLAEPGHVQHYDVRPVVGAWRPWL